MWVYGLVAPVKHDVAVSQTDIAVLQEQISCIPEIKNDLKQLTKNVERLMIYQGVSPLKFATSTINN